MPPKKGALQYIVIFYKFSIFEEHNNMTFYEIFTVYSSGHYPVFFVTTGLRAVVSRQQPAAGDTPNGGDDALWRTQREPDRESSRVLENYRRES